METLFENKFRDLPAPPAPEVSSPTPVTPRPISINKRNKQPVAIVPAQSDAKISQLEKEIEALKSMIVQQNSPAPAKASHKRKKSESTPATKKPSPKPKSKPSSSSSSSSTSASTPSSSSKKKSSSSGKSKEKSKSSKSKSKSKPKVAEMTFQEKEKLSTDIGKLPPEASATIVDIIHKHHPDLRDAADELEIEMDSLDDATLREMQQFVNSTLNASKHEDHSGISSGSDSSDSSDESGSDSDAD